MIASKCCSVSVVAKMRKEDGRGEDEDEQEVLVVHCDPDDHGKCPARCLRVCLMMTVFR